MKTTKQDLVDLNRKLSNENALMQLYLYDSQRCNGPDAVETGELPESETIQLMLYRATSPSGGYVVSNYLDAKGSVLSSSIARLDDLEAYWQHNDAHTQHSYALRACVSKLVSYRRNALDEAQAHAMVRQDHPANGEEATSTFHALVALRDYMPKLPTHLREHVQRLFDLWWDDELNHYISGTGIDGDDDAIAQARAENDEARLTGASA